MAYIQEHYREELSLDRLAGEFFVSKYYLSHRFKKTVNASVYRYIFQRRRLMAKDCLRGGVPPTECCERCGFRDYANFYRLFKAEYGVSPQAFAREYHRRTAPAQTGSMDKE